MRLKQFKSELTKKLNVLEHSTIQVVLQVLENEYSIELHRKHYEDDIYFSDWDAFDEKDFEEIIDSVDKTISKNQ